VLDGSVVSIDRPPATKTVLEYLREDLGRTGTKEGCAEGDCGACTVVVGELREGGRRVHYRAVNSCIRFLPTLDGKELITVESLSDAAGPLHPVQRSMVEHHASQCGFCTPGFVMSLFALYLQEERADRERVLDTLSGNLCRCTGYRPIIDAGMRQWDYPPTPRWTREYAHSEARAAALAARVPGFHAPRTLDELADALAARPDSLMLAGGTDVGLWVTKQLRELPPILYLGDVAELNQVRERPQELWIGAAVSIAEAWRALCGRFPALKEQAARFASPPIRNSATLCGNLANGSPIGDSIPALIALGAELELRRASRVRRLPLEDFYLGYQKKDLAAGEFVVGVAIPLPAPGQRLASYKLSKRIDQDISAVCATFRVSTQGARVLDARLAFGGLAGIACRARRAERALSDGGFTHEGIEAAVAALAADFTPLSDLRASGEYRLRTAGNLLRRFFLEQQAGHEPTRTADAMRRVN
jgi:xanthine dehydrogenase small subunit